MKLPVLTAILVLLAPFPAMADDGADVTVERLHEALLAGMREADSLGYEGRSAKLAPVIEATFDVPRISRIVAGRYWKQFSADEQQAFTGTFKRLVIANYADRFDSYSGESFRRVSIEPLKRDRQLVRTVLVKGDGDEVNLDYIITHGDGSWRIVNVIADGVSDLALKRADYAAILGTEGLAVLLEKIGAQIEDHARSK